MVFTMEHTQLQLAHLPPAGLTGPELQDLALISNNAKSMGWLAADETIVARRDADGIIVSVVAGASRREQRYADAGRWLYQLLHDLAHGAWKPHDVAVRTESRC